MVRNTIVLCMLSASLALTGCVSTKNVRADLGGMRAASYGTVTVSMRQKPDFAAITAGKAAIGGLIGALAMVAAGNTIVDENNVKDPAIYIGDELAKSLAASLGAQAVDNGGKVAATAKPAELAQLYAGADLLLDVQTVNWSFGYFPSDWNNYRVMYSAKLRLVDTRTGSLKAEGFCSRMPEKSADAPSRDQLLADQAARLKSELKLAADHCIGQFKANVLGV